MANIKLTLSIFGSDFNPASMKEVTSLQPTGSWREGELVPNTKIPIERKENCWEFSVDSLNTLFLEDATDELVTSLNPDIQNIERFIRRNGLKSKIEIWIEAHRDEMPSLYFNSKFIQLALSVNGEIDIDLYCL